MKTVTVRTEETTQIHDVHHSTEKFQSATTRTGANIQKSGDIFDAAKAAWHQADHRSLGSIMPATRRQHVLR